MKTVVAIAFTFVFLFFSSFVFAKEPICNYEILFSSQDRISEELLSLIHKEKKSIRVAVYCLMDSSIAKALLNAKKRGVLVEVIADPFSVKKRSPLHALAKSEIPIFIWNPPHQMRKGKTKKAPLMHQKFCIFGEEKVWTGSFNFTFEASHSNRENVVILDHKEVAGRYLEEFVRIKEEGCVPFQEFLMKKQT